jgi:hypothetical protein
VQGIADKKNGIMSLSAEKSTHLRVRNPSKNPRFPRNRREIKLLTTQLFAVSDEISTTCDSVANSSIKNRGSAELVEAKSKIIIVVMPFPFQF